MAIQMQGAWTLQVLSRTPGARQRFVVAGATAGSGIHDATPGKMIFVGGARWTIALQHRPAGFAWFELGHRIGTTSIGHGLVEFDLRAVGAGEEGERGAFVIACLRLAGRTEWRDRSPQTVHDRRACA